MDGNYCKFRALALRFVEWLETPLSNKGLYLVDSILCFCHDNFADILVGLSRQLPPDNPSQRVQRVAHDGHGVVLRLSPHGHSDVKKRLCAYGRSKIINVFFRIVRRKR